MGYFSHIRHAAKSDVGRKRGNNEDAVGAWPDAGIFCVADGMGGGDDGEIASAAVVKGLDGVAPSLAPCNGRARPFPAVLDAVSKTIDAVSSWVCDRAAARRLNGCGSTFAGICFDASNPSSAVALHAGDSRLYRFRDGKAEQLTKDHSAAEMIGAKDERDVNPMFRGMILRCVGAKPAVELERTPVEVREGDLFLLCSDGLYRMVALARMAEIAVSSDNVSEIASSLVDAANDAGGIDNVSVVVLKAGALPPALPVDPSASAAEIEPVMFSGDRSRSEQTLTTSGVPSAAMDCCEASDEGVETPGEKKRAPSLRAALAWLAKKI